MEAALVPAAGRAVILPSPAPSAGRPSRAPRSGAGGEPAPACGARAAAAEHRPLAARRVPPRAGTLITSVPCCSLRRSAGAPRGSITLDRTPPAAAAPAEMAGRLTLEFAKYHGLGNDFILVDNRHSPDLRLTPAQAARLCDRNFGVGADGVIFVLPGAPGGASDYGMRIINSDGSEPEMCGNGIRCMARFVAELEGGAGDGATRRYTVDTRAGPIVPELRPDGQVCVDMGPPVLEPEKVPTTLRAAAGAGGAAAPVVGALLEVGGRQWLVTCVSMGNPHCVTFGDASGESLDVASLDLAQIGPLFEKNPAFPARTNTEFVEVVSRSELKMRVWERGAGPTLACGTGACALLVAAVLEGRADRVCTVHLPGGPLQIEWREADNHVYMTGPAELTFAGRALL